MVQKAVAGRNRLRRCAANQMRRRASQAIAKSARGRSRRLGQRGPPIGRESKVVACNASRREAKYEPRSSRHNPRLLCRSDAKERTRPPSHMRGAHSQQRGLASIQRLPASNWERASQGLARPRTPIPDRAVPVGRHLWAWRPYPHLSTAAAQVGRSRKGAGGCISLRGRQARSSVLGWHSIQLHATSCAVSMVFCSIVTSSTTSAQLRDISRMHWPCPCRPNSGAWQSLQVWLIPQSASMRYVAKPSCSQYTSPVFEPGPAFGKYRAVLTSRDERGEAVLPLGPVSGH